MWAGGVQIHASKTPVIRLALFFFALVYDLETFCCHHGKTGPLAVRSAPSFLFKGTVYVTQKTNTD